MDMKNEGMLIVRRDSVLQFCGDRVYKKYFYKFLRHINPGLHWYDVDYKNHNNDLQQNLFNNAMTSYKLAEQFGLIIHYSDDEYIYT